MGRIVSSPLTGTSKVQVRRKERVEECEYESGVQKRKIVQEG